MDSPNKDITERKALIVYENVAVCHDELEVVKNVSFSVYPNDFVFLTGPVGSGKSSILRTIYRDIKISTGKACVLGYDLLSMRNKQVPILRKQLGIIFQDYKLLGNLTVEKNLSFILRAIGIRGKEEIASRITETLRLVGLEEKKDYYPNELSGGEQQRAAIARAIINNPKVILADEPTGNLDKEAAYRITSLLFDISKKGTAVIMSTHNIDLIEKFAGSVYECTDGLFHKVSDPVFESKNIETTNTDIQDN